MRSSRRHLLPMLLLLCVSCREKQPIDARDASPATSAAPIASKPIALVSSEASSPIAMKPSASASPFESPPWPSAPKELLLTLTWVVYPPRADPKHAGDPASERHPVELVARIGNVARHISLPPMSGGVFPDQQGVCRAPREPIAVSLRSSIDASPSVAGPLAWITFSLGGKAGFVIERVSESALAVIEISQSDGACPMSDGGVESCPMTRKLLGVLPVPIGIGVREVMLMVEGPSRETPYRCE